MKRCTLMVDPTVSRVRLLADLVSLRLDLAMMDMVDLVMMVSNWEVDIKRTWDAGGSHCSELFNQVRKVLR